MQILVSSNRTDEYFHSACTMMCMPASLTALPYFLLLCAVHCTAALPVSVRVGSGGPSSVEWLWFTITHFVFDAGDKSELSYWSSSCTDACVATRRTATTDQRVVRNVFSSNRFTPTDLPISNRHKFVCKLVGCSCKAVLEVVLLTHTKAINWNTYPAIAFGPRPVTQGEETLHCFSTMRPGLVCTCK